MQLILGKMIVATGFKKWPKVQKIAQSGHTGSNSNVLWERICFFLMEKGGIEQSKR